MPKSNLTTPASTRIPPPQPLSVNAVDMGPIHHELGALSEAVTTLKKQSNTQAGKLEKVCEDVTSAKAAGKVLWWVAVLVASIVGGIVTEYFHHYVFGVVAK